MTKITNRIMDNRNKDSNPFADYVWMGDMDSFDREIEAQIEEEFEEEEFIKSCIEQLLEEEEERETVFFQKPKDHDKSNNVPNGHQNQEQQNIYPPISEMGPNDCNNIDIIHQHMNNMYISQLDELPAPPHQSYQNGDISYPHPPHPPYQNGDIPQMGFDVNHLPFWLYPNNHNNTVGNTQPMPYPGPSELQKSLSPLNPHASPFVMNPNAKEFVPQKEFSPRSSSNYDVHKQTST